MTLSPTERQRARELCEKVVAGPHGWSEAVWTSWLVTAGAEALCLLLPNVLAALEEAEAEIAALKQLAEDRADYFASTEDR